MQKWIKYNRGQDLRCKLSDYMIRSIRELSHSFTYGEIARMKHLSYNNVRYWCDDSYKKHLINLSTQWIKENGQGSYLGNDYKRCKERKKKIFKDMWVLK